MAIRDRYFVDSNKQSDYGRYNVMITPISKALTGYIIEFKAFDPDFHDSLDEVIAEAFNQIEERQYATELARRGVEHIKKLAIVFKGQEVKIVEGKEGGAS